MNEAELLAQANTWEVRHGGFSGRTAQQFIYYLNSLPKSRRFPGPPASRFISRQPIGHLFCMAAGRCKKKNEKKEKKDLHF